MIYNNENVAFYDPHFLSYQWWIFVNLQRGSGGTFADICKLVLQTIHIMLPRIVPVYAKMLTNLLQAGHLPPPLAPQKSACQIFMFLYVIMFLKLTSVLFSNNKILARLSVC